ncbi:MAG: hypothetical protein IJZ56_02640 [Oscillospiraceae bacterium]|nr:hypothetical protein [Oscillospiraceae bacterium]
MNKHRLFCLLLAVCLMLCHASPVFAADETAETVEQAIIDACTYQRSGDIAQYRITTWDLKKIYSDLHKRGKLPWYASTDYTYTYDQKTNYVNDFEPGAVDANADMAAYEERVAQILDDCVFEGMDQWQIALSIHDYLIAHAAYDETLESNGSYDLLVEGSAVCAGYARAYQDLMLRAGIDCRYVVSEAMDHAWNLVDIDGKWYHVDLTWDDPSPNIAGFVDHKYFLLTDEEISAGDNPHYDWDTNLTCDDTRFSDGFWRDVNSAILYESSDTSYLLRADEYLSRIYRRDENTGKETLIYKEPSNYIDIGHGNYIYEHHGLSQLGGRLWFCTVSKVQSVKLDGSDLQTHYQNTGNTYIYGCHAQEGGLYLSLMTHDGDRTDRSSALDPSGDHIHSFTRTVTDATCTEKGYTSSVCHCGLEAVSTPAEATDHSYIYQDGTKASFFNAGYADYTCENCQHSYREDYPQLSFTGFVEANAAVIAVAAFVVIRLLFRIFRKRK